MQEKVFASLCVKIFEAFSIQRWQDLIRPFNLIQMDQAAESMMISFILAKYEENQGRKIDYEYMIYASLFRTLKKIALCDIKSPVLDMIKIEYPKEYEKLNSWVCLQYEDLMQDDGLFNRFKEYLKNEGKNNLNKEEQLAFRIFCAANKYATYRELQMIAKVNEQQRWQKIEKELLFDLQQYLDLKGASLLLTKQKPHDLILKIEQLRFQTRWNQTQRIPATSVLGHCYFVAILTLLLCLFNPCCNKKRLYNNFFCALFHDLPEAVTRDIISPVKQATGELPCIVKMIEEQVVQKELFPFTEDFYRQELEYFIQDEFSNRIKTKDGTKQVSFEELNTIYQKDEYMATDGRLVRLADHIAAFMEADVSMKSGVSSKQLQDGRQNLLDIYSKIDEINAVDVGQLFSSLQEALCR